MPAIPLAVGCDVTVLAQRFDDSTDHSWCKKEFKGRWKSAKLRGTVTKIEGTGDSTKAYINFDHYDFEGDCLKKHLIVVAAAPDC
jgi:hypothetical protein